MSTTNTFEYTAVAVTSLVTTAETAVLTIGPISDRGPSDTIEIAGQIIVTAGGGTTAVQMRVRRGQGVSGTQVGVTAPTPLSAATQGVATFQVTDTPGEVGGQYYTVTCQQVSATGNGSTAYATAEVTLP